MNTIARLVTPVNPGALIWEADTTAEGIQVCAYYPNKNGDPNDPALYHALLLPWVVCHELVELLALRQPARFQAVLRRFAALGIAMEDTRKGDTQ